MQLIVLVMSFKVPHFALNEFQDDKLNNWQIKYEINHVLQLVFKQREQQKQQQQQQNPDLELRR